MFHLIALYKNTYYYFGCAASFRGVAALHDLYLHQYPNINKLQSRWHPYKEMTEFVKDFKTFEAFDKEYIEHEKQKDKLLQEITDLSQELGLE